VVWLVLVWGVVLAWPGSPASAVTGTEQELDAAATPWAVGVYAVNELGNRRLLCSGALVGPTVVLTAAHCVVGSEEAYAAGTISVGVATTPGATSQDVELVGVVRAVAHPGYRPRSVTSKHDIAVLELAAPVSVPWLSVTPVEGGLPELLDAYGWGVDSRHRFRGTLGRANGRPATRRELRGYPRLDPVRQGAVMPTGAHSACVGDSGGPVVTGGESPVLVGVVSYGPTACGRSPMVFSRVSGYSAWIASVTGG
jgi:secreted trypsin-like serine protease